MFKNPIILLDLDHTLYDAVTPWKNLVSNIFIKELKWKKFTWKTYFAIREHYKVFDLFFDDSFRHYWLSQELISLLLGIKNDLISTKDLLEELERFELRLSLIKAKECRPSKIFNESHKFLNSCPELKNAIDLINNDKDEREVLEIKEKFKTAAKINCYDGVLDLIKYFSNNNSRFYLVSEGDYELQVWKAKLLGIEKFFLRKILVTELYRHSIEYSKNLKIIKNVLHHSNYEKISKSENVEIADNIVRKYELLKLKESLFFYFAILKCIDKDYNNPEEIFDSAIIDELININDFKSRKIIMIGDRIDKDLLPIWKINGLNSELIRLKSGKYKFKESLPNIPKTVYKEYSNFKSIYNYVTHSLV